MAVSENQAPNEGSNSIGVLLDIDGVLTLLGKPIPGSSEALQKLTAPESPYTVCYLSNGGGMSEATKAKSLAKSLGVEVRSEQVVLAQTPFKSLVEEYRNKNVLVIGDDMNHLLTDYGFKNLFEYKDFLKMHPGMFHIYQKPDGTATPATKIDLVLVIYEPLIWGGAIQACLDVLTSPNGVIGGFEAGVTNKVPIYFCNNDQTFPSDFPNPRITQGMFRLHLEASFKALTGVELTAQACGKPMSISYQYAKTVLDNEAKQKGLPSPKRFYAVGDNPKSDIRGGRLMEGCSPILVRTGLHKGGNDVNDPADHVVENLLEAVNYMV